MAGLGMCEGPLLAAPVLRAGSRSSREPAAVAKFLATLGRAGLFFPFKNREMRGSRLSCDGFPSARMGMAWCNERPE